MKTVRIPQCGFSKAGTKMTQKLPTLPHPLLVECRVAILLSIRAQGPPAHRASLVLSVPGSVGDLGWGVSVKRTPKSLSSRGIQSMFVMGRGEQ